MMDPAIADLLKGGGGATVIILAFWLLVLPIVRTSTAEVAASREERKTILLPMIVALTALTASIQTAQQQNSESHVGLMQSIVSLQGAVGILCDRANGGK